MSGRRVFIYGRLALTTTRQSPGAPVIDACAGRIVEGGRWWRGRAIHLSPWRLDRYGDRKAGLALCIGFLDRPAAHQEA